MKKNKKNKTVPVGANDYSTLRKYIEIYKRLARSEDGDREKAEQIIDMCYGKLQRY